MSYPPVANVWGSAADRPRCDQCRWWVASGIQAMRGECHYNPPSAARAGHAWPNIAAIDWCREFSAATVDALSAVV
jgi:hypothetical protein